MRGKLATVIDQIEHGHHVFRAYFKHAVLKQYEKFSTFLRNELCSSNLTDFGLRKGLDHLDEVRQTFQTITSRFAGFQAQWLNVHVDFPLLILCRFSDAGNDETLARSGSRRSKSAKARNRGR